MQRGNVAGATEEPVADASAERNELTEVERNLLVQRFSQMLVNEADEYLKIASFGGEKKYFFDIIDLLTADENNTNAETILKEMKSIKKYLDNDCKIGELRGNEMALRGLYRFLGMALGAVTGFFAGAKMGALAGGVVLSVPAAVVGAGTGAAAGAGLGFFAGNKLFNTVHSNSATSLRDHDLQSSFYNQVEAKFTK